MAGRRFYVRCKVSKGIFDNELYVALETASAYVDRSQVLLANEPKPGEDVDGLVIGYVIDENDKRDKALVELSGQPVVGGLRTWISVSKLEAQLAVA